MKKQLSLVLTILFLNAWSLEAQHDLAPCGSNDYYSPWLREYLSSGANQSPRTDGILYIPIQIHVVGTDQGSGYFSKTGVYNAFCKLNENFTEAEIQFFLAGDIRYIDNTAYYDHEYDAGRDMMYENNVDNVINCYIVDSPAGNCGYFTYGADAIALAKNCMGPADDTWAHEVGHYLSLPHTFWGWEWPDELNFDEAAPAQVGNVQVEKVDGSNCANSGDGFCDTPPDYLRYRWSCNSDGLSNTTQLDPDGVEFTSDGSFFMSYANSFCMNRFSGEQIDAMRANIETERTYLLTTAPDEETITVAETSEVTVLSPEEGVVQEGSSVHIEWEPIPNATHYLIQINPFSIFSIVFNEFIVDEPYLDFTNLVPNKTFSWRVRPYNPYFTCTDFTGAQSFQTGGLILGTDELREGESLQVFPNPSKDGNVWMEVTSLSTTTANWEITNISGQLLLNGKQEVITGTQRFSLDSHQLPKGMYLAGLQLGDRKVYRKFIVQ